MIRSDLHQFCAGEDDVRYYIHQPWSRGEWTYATNGYIIVRVARLADVDENEKAPNAEKIFADSKQTEFIPVPECAMPEDVECDTCDGDGEHECGKCDNKHECGDCDGEGMVQAPATFVDVGNAKFADIYLAMIQGWEIAPNGQGAAWIRNGEASGLLMPRRKDE